jgi:hypothetical protein
MILDGSAEIVRGETVLGIERTGADEDAVIEREDRARMHLARHGDEPEGRGRLSLKRVKWSEEENDCKEEPANAAGDSRDLYHSILYVFADGRWAVFITLSM